MFSRTTVFAAEQGQSAKFLGLQRDIEKGDAAAHAAFFGGTGSQFFGLSAAPISGALSVSIGTGSLWQYEGIDPTSWSTLPADSSQWLLQGLVTASQTITGFAAPAISGDSITYLLEAQIQVQDTAAVSTPFYNSANPAQPVYQQKSPNRQNVVVFHVKAGTAAPTGTQTAPAADSGWVPLYTVTVDYGETQLQSNDIALASGAPAFYGFVPVNPSGNTPVYLNPAAPQSGTIQLSGYSQFTGTTLNNGTYSLAANLVPDNDFFYSQSAHSSAVDWTNSGLTYSATGGPSGAPAYTFTGTGSASGTLGITSTKFYVIAGKTYSFGGYISCPAFTTGTPAWQILDASNGSVIQSFPQLASASGTITGSFVAPSSGIIQVYGGTGNANFASGGTFVVSQPMVNGGPVSLPYTTIRPLQNYAFNVQSGLQSDYINVTGHAPSVFGTTEVSMILAGSIAYNGSHAGSDADPYPLSQLNVAMLGGKLASDYALAAGNYITVYSGTPTLATGNAGITGQFTANAPQGTAPFIVQSNTMVANLNANYVGGYAAGNSSGSIPISNGTLNSNLNAQYLNGLASSSFQPAGNYAEMNVANTGSFTSTGPLISQGGTGSTQVALEYLATNSSGFNSGGPAGILYSASAPLGLSSSSVRTNCPLYVGDATRQNIYMQDSVPSGLVRSGVMTYRVTRGAGSSNNPAPVTPGSGSDYGYWPQMGGGISYSALGGSPETITWRTVVTFASSLSVVFNIRANDAVSIYIDGAYKFSQYGFSATQCFFNYTFSAGTHTVDITYSGDGSGDDRLVVFPWVPMPSGSITSAITSAVPG